MRAKKSTFLNEQDKLGKCKLFQKYYIKYTMALNSCFKVKLTLIARKQQDA